MQDLLDMTSGAFVTVVIAALGFNPLGAFAAGVLLGKICNIGGTVHPDGIHAISVRVLSYQRPSGPGVIGYGIFDKAGDVFDLDFFAVFVDEFHVGVIPVQHFFANGAGRAGVLAIYRARNQSEKILHGENVGRDHHISVRQIARVDIVFY